MSRTLRLCLIYLLILSPILVDVIASWYSPFAARRGNFGLLLIEAAGVAGIGIIGLIVSVLSRKRAKADTISLSGYLIPALIVCGYVIYRV